jgi:hypothetical protein
MGGFNVEFFDANGGCFATGEMAEPDAFAAAMNAPTPREQELEAQVYARNIEILNVHKNREHLSQIQRGKTIDADKAFNDLVAMIDRLEAQNKALWELVGDCERLFRLISSTIYNDNGDIGMEPITACSAAESGIAAIQKAKEVKVPHQYDVEMYLYGLIKQNKQKA